MATFKEVRNCLNRVGEHLKSCGLLDPMNRSYVWHITKNIYIHTYSPSTHGYGTFLICVKFGKEATFDVKLIKVQIENGLYLFPIRNENKEFVDECMNLDVNMRIDTETFKKFCNKHFRPFGDLIYTVLNLIAFNEEEDEEKMIDD